MYKLMVSYDCGIHYECAGESENLDDFQAKTDEFDKQYLRWVIEDDGELQEVSAIHKNIVNTMIALGSMG